ncbi:hypothetical protein Trydic_g16365 [Trypoxylus dichotomus]
MVNRKAFGEAASVNGEKCQNWIANILSMMLRYYKEEYIFDENSSFTVYQITKNDKRSQERVMCFNKHITSLPMIMCKKHKPRCFQNTKALPVQRELNPKNMDIWGVFLPSGF